MPETTARAVDPASLPEITDPLEQIAAAITQGGETTDDMRRVLANLIRQYGADNPKFNRLAFQTRVGATDLMSPYGVKTPQVPKGHRDSIKVTKPQGAEETMRAAIRQMLIQGEPTTQSKRQISNFKRAVEFGQVDPRTFNEIMSVYRQAQTPEQREAFYTKPNLRTKKNKKDLIMDKATGKPKLYESKYAYGTLAPLGKRLRSGFPIKTKAELAGKASAKEDSAEVEQTPEVAARAKASGRATKPSALQDRPQLSPEERKKATELLLMDQYLAK